MIIIETSVDELLKFLNEKDMPSPKFRRLADAMKSGNLTTTDKARGLNCGYQDW